MEKNTKKKVTNKKCKQFQIRTVLVLRQAYSIIYFLRGRDSKNSKNRQKHFSGPWDFQGV